jgi:hypothetical protein
MGDGSDLRAMGGTSTTEPVFGFEAFWVPDSARTAAAATGATVVDRSSAVVTHLAEVVRSNASRLLSRQDVSMLVDGLRYDEPLLANEVGSDHLPLQTLHAVLRGCSTTGFRSATSAASSRRLRAGRARRAPSSSSPPPLASPWAGPSSGASPRTGRSR